MRPRTAIAAALSICAAFQAAASDLSIFQHPDFRGRQFMLRADTRDLAVVGYLGAVSSLVVRSGRWEVCSEPDFKGHCAIFPRGEYPTLNGRFNDRVASARLVSIP
jgi:hypothetical protein